MDDLDLYDVEFGGFTTQMQLNEKDAEAYGDRASKVGSIDQVEPVVTHHGIQIEDPAADGEKQAEAPKNKSRAAVSKTA